MSLIHSIPRKKKKKEREKWRATARMPTRCRAQMSNATDRHRALPHSLPICLSNKPPPAPNSHRLHFLQILMSLTPYRYHHCLHPRVQHSTESSAVTVIPLNLSANTFEMVSVLLNPTSCTQWVNQGANAQVRAPRHHFLRCSRPSGFLPRQRIPPPRLLLLHLRHLIHGGVPRPPWHL